MTDKGGNISKIEQDKTKCQKFLSFLWNSDKGEFLGRTGISWLKITVFYIIFYACLAGFFIIMLVVFYQTLHVDRPKWVLDGSRIGSSPGLGFRPEVPEDMRGSSTLIFYNSTRNDSTSYFTDYLDNYFKAYSEAQVGDKVKDCNIEDGAEDKRACRIALMGKEEPCSKENKYGFPQGKPCILIKLNRIYDWKPVDYDSPPNELVDKLGGEHKYKKGHVFFTCEGENPADRDNVGSIKYYPEDGVSFAYYPFTNQDQYVSPFVFLHFESIRKGVIVNVECRAWAANIHYNKADRLGSVHFELLVD